MNTLKAIAMAVLPLAFSCSVKVDSALLLDKAPLEGIIDGKKVELITIEKDNIAAQFSNFGARGISLSVPDKDGESRDIVLGYTKLESYRDAAGRNSASTVGRFANRIAKGQFYIDSTLYNVTRNEGENHIHGGKDGFAVKVWNIKQVSDSSVTMQYFSADGEEGFPGNLTVELTYTLTEDRALKIDYKASTDKATVINLTNHAYFNLNGDNSSTLDNELYIAASQYTPVSEQRIPTGEIAKVEGTPLDFSMPHPIGDSINSNHYATKSAKGYDHNFVFDSRDISELKASLYSPVSGITLELYTNQPAVQIYTSNYLNKSDNCKGGVTYTPRCGVALEAQNFPDAPNHANFPSAVLRPDQVYTQTTIYKFLN